MGAGGGRMRLRLASANPDKVAEIEALLDEAGIEVVPRPAGLADVEETGTTLLANARLKAAAVMNATGEPAVADDTGLEVEHLGGAPGVHTARFAGPAARYADNVAKLLDALAGVPAPGRRARFRTVALVLFPDGRQVAAEGVVDGVIAEGPRGTGGFGYDPVFVPDDAGGRTLAELAPAEKHGLSHRGRAFRALAAQLRA